MLQDWLVDGFPPISDSPTESPKDYLNGYNLLIILVSYLTNVSLSGTPWGLNSLEINLRFPKHVTLKVVLSANTRQVVLVRIIIKVTLKATAEILLEGQE